MSAVNLLPDLHLASALVRPPTQMQRWNAPDNLTYPSGKV